jgi:hypothetical protein
VAGDWVALVDFESDQATYRQVGECSGANPNQHLMILHGKVDGNHDRGPRAAYRQPTNRPLFGGQREQLVAFGFCQDFGSSLVNPHDRMPSSEPISPCDPVPGPAQLQSFGRGRYACSMSQPTFRLREKISCPSKGGIEYDFTWHRRQQVRRCRTGRLVAMKIPVTEPHCSDLQVCHPRAWGFSVSYVDSLPDGLRLQQGQRSQGCRATSDVAVHDG